MQVRDVAVEPRGLSITLPVSKGDPRGVGAVVAIPPGGQGLLRGGGVRAVVGGVRPAGRRSVPPHPRYAVAAGADRRADGAGGPPPCPGHRGAVRPFDRAHRPGPGHGDGAGRAAVRGPFAQARLADHGAAPQLERLARPPHTRRWTPISTGGTRSRIIPFPIRDQLDDALGYAYWWLSLA